MSAKLWNIDNPGDFQYKVDLLTKLTLRGCKTVWGWQRLTEADRGRTVVCFLSQGTAGQFTSESQYNAGAWYECLDRRPVCLLYYFVNTINSTSSVYCHRWDVLIAILGAQKQRISRLGLELKHEQGVGNRLKKGEWESFLLHKQNRWQT